MIGKAEPNPWPHNWSQTLGLEFTQKERFPDLCPLATSGKVDKERYRGLSEQAAGLAGYRDTDYED